MNKEELKVSALQNGTVIDHIPSSKLMDVISLLHLENIKTPVTVGYNLKSKKMGEKSLIKIADKFFTDEEINQLSVVAPNVSLSREITSISLLEGIWSITVPFWSAETLSSSLFMAILF